MNRISPILNRLFDEAQPAAPGGMSLSVRPPLLTVAICTRNPRADYFDRVLGALAAQTLPASLWEFIIVDSASDQPLTPARANAAGLACRMIRLEISGLLRARFAAIAAAAAP